MNGSGGIAENRPSARWAVRDCSPKTSDIQPIHTRLAWGGLSGTSSGESASARDTLPAGKASRRPLHLMAALVIHGLITACALAQPYETFPLDTTRVFGPDIRDVDRVRLSYSTQSQVALLGWDGFAGRVGATGQVLDTPSICVDPRANGDEPADVAAGPEGFAYVYVADVGDSSCTIASIVASDGRVSGRAVLDFTCACFSPAVASDGEGYLACWMSWDWTNLRILFARLDSAGAVLDSARIRCQSSGS